jgi:hypothetical protein
VRTASPASSSATTSGSSGAFDPCCPHRSRARSRTRTSGASSACAIHWGRTSCYGNGAGALFTSAVSAWFDPTGGAGLAAGVAESVRGDGLCGKTGGDSDGPPTLASGSTFATWSDDAGPQAGSPTSSKRPKSSARRRHSRRREGRDGRMFSDLSGDVMERESGLGGGGTASERRGSETDQPVCVPRIDRRARRRRDERAVRYVET